MRRLVALLPAMACALLACGAAPADAQRRGAPPVLTPAGPASEALADSLAAAALAGGGTPAARLAAFARAAKFPGRPLVRAVADTMGAELVLAVQVLPDHAVALRLVSGDRVRRVEGAAAGASPAGLHAIERVWLAQVRPLYEQPLTRVALAWFGEPGEWPHALWVAPVDSVPGVTPGLYRTALVSGERTGDGGLRVTSRAGETLVAVRERGWSGASAVDAGMCVECPRLGQETVWRVDGVTATRLRVGPVDDAPWAVARAFDARRGYRAWSDRDVTVSPDVDRWMKARRWAVLHAVTPLGGEDARVLLSSRGPADSLGVVVKKAGSGWAVTQVR